MNFISSRLPAFAGVIIVLPYHVVECNSFQGLNLKIRHQGSSHGNDHQGNLSFKIVFIWLQHGPVLL